MKSRLFKILAAAGVVLALATGAAIAIAATEGDSGSGDTQRVAQETDAPKDANEGKPWLGVAVDDTAEADGVEIVHVAPDGPAADAGLAEGDTITAVDGTNVNSHEELKTAINGHSAGDEVTLKVTKKDATGSTDVKVTLATRPDDVEFHGGFGDIEGMLGERFDRFLGGTFRYLDDDGKEVRVETVPGTITAISDTEIKIDVNGDEGERTFSIGADAKVPDGLETGNRVVVMLKNDELTAVSGGSFPMMPFGPGGLDGPIRGALPRICEGIEDGNFPRMDRFCEKIAPPDTQAEPTPQA